MQNKRFCLFKDDSKYKVYNHAAQIINKIRMEQNDMHFSLRIEFLTTKIEYKTIYFED